MKKFFIIFLAVFVIGTANAAYAADGAYINLASGEGEYIDVTVNSSVVELGGKEALEITDGNFNYISCKVDNDYVYNLKGASVITVSYFDGAAGGFYVRYTDVSGTVKATETVSLGGSGEWKKYSFAITDSAYIDGISNTDFRIYIADENSVAFSDISLEIQELYFELKIDSAGRSFTEKEGVRLVLTTDSQLKDDFEFPAELVIKDSDGKSVYTKTYTLTAVGKALSDSELSAVGIEPGFYTAYVTAAVGEESYILDENFSISKASAEQKDGIFGMCTHLHMYESGSPELTNLVELLKKSGVEWVRDEYYWDRVETEKGVYNFYADGYINACVDAGITPFVVLNYGNDLYGGVPHDEAGYKAFAAYAAAVAEHLKGKVKYYEVWNEFNAGWNDGYGIEEYANILKYTYNALKAVDPEITVVAGATSLTRPDWFESLFETELDGKSMFEYCDAVSYHPYAYPYPPEYFGENGNIEVNFKKMYKMMEKFGTPKPQWISEVGWYTGSANKNATEKEQANYLARTFIQGKIYGVERVFWYDFMNDGINAADSEQNYGIISNFTSDTPYEPKPSYLSFAAVSSILGGTEFVKEYKPTEDLRIITFRNIAEDKEVNVIYSVDNNPTPFILTGDNLKLDIYNIYGARCRIKEIDGAPVYVVGKTGEFDPLGFVTAVRSHGIATFGSTFKNDGINVLSDETEASAGGRNSYLLSESDDSILLDIDDSWIYSDSTALSFSVDYRSLGTGSFCIEYTAADGSLKTTEAVSLDGIYGYATAEFEIDGMMCSNSLEGGDIKIRTDNPGDGIYFIALRAKEPNSGTPLITAEFEGEIFETLNDGTGLNLKLDDMAVLGRDASTEFRYVEKEGRHGIYVPNISGQRYIHIDIDDDILFGGLNDITVSVDYFDEGVGCFDLVYSAGRYDKLYPLNNVVQLENSGQWKTAVFRLKNNAWLENQDTDLRIALWTGNMGYSPEAVTFGGVRIKNNKEDIDFELEYSEKDKSINISGYTEADSGDIVSIQILQLGKTAEDIAADNSNGSIIHFAEAVNKPYYDYKKYEYSFKQDLTSGAYLVRVNTGNKVMEKYIYCRNMYDVDSIVIKDSEGKIVSKNQLSGINGFTVSTGVQSNYDNTGVCLAAAVYDEQGKLKAVDFAEDYVTAGDKILPEITVKLTSPVNDGDRIKIFVLKDMTSIIPIRPVKVIGVR